MDKIHFFVFLFICCLEESNQVYKVNTTLTDLQKEVFFIQIKLVLTEAVI